jgi:four helix bundle protein
MQTASRLLVLDLTVDTIRILAPVVEIIRRRDRDLADQLRRAATSVALNLAESRGSDDGNRRARLRTALGSTHEARAALRVAEAWGYVEDSRVAPIDASLDRIAAMTWSLARR